MKKIALLAVAFVFTAVFAMSATAQAGAQPGAGKIGWIITGAFGDDKEGIKTYVAAEKTLDAEMKPMATELQNLRTRINTIQDELTKMGSNPAVPVNPQAAAAKQEEGQRLSTEFKRKQEDAQAKFAKRRDEVLGPIQTAIFKALDDYAKQKGYSVILDVSAMIEENRPSPILVLDQTANITKDFITYYNARPATTATTAAPK